MFGILKKNSEILLDDRKHFGHEVLQQPGGVHDPLPRNRGRAGVGAWKCKYFISRTKGIILK